MIADFPCACWFVGLPALLAFPPGCKSSRCLSRCMSYLDLNAVYWIIRLWRNIKTFISWCSLSQTANFLLYSIFLLFFILLFLLCCLQWDVKLFIFLRYDGELSVDAVTDWLATNILSLPRILYYSKESLVIHCIHIANTLKCCCEYFWNDLLHLFPFYCEDRRYWMIINLDWHG